MREIQTANVVWRWAGALLALLLICGIRGECQNITGQIDGVVTDVSGSRIANAQVVLTNEATRQVVRTAKTDEKGHYIASLLQVGSYAISVNVSGFRSQEENGITLNVSDNLTLDFRMTPGASENVIVTADNSQSPNIETNENSTIVSEGQIKELALNTRNFEQMLLLQPGVSYGGPDEEYTGQVDPTGARNAHQLSVNGLQPTQVQFQLDGADMLNHTTNGQVAIFPTIDAIQQIQTVRNNYGAQYGGGGSAQSIVVTKAGGAAFHGDLYYFFRHQALNATPYFNLLNGVPKPPIRQNDYGFTIGGPVFLPNLYPRDKSRTFFFYSQEFRRSAVATQNTNVNYPTLANTAGYFKTPVCIGIYSTTGCSGAVAAQVTNSPYPGYNYQIPAAAISPVATEYLKDVITPAVLAVPASINPATPNSVLLQESSVTSETQELARVDHKFSDRLNGFFRFINDPIEQHIPNSIYRGVGIPTVTATTVNSYGRDYLAHLTWTARANTVLDFGFSYLPYQTQAIPTQSATQANSPDIKVNLPFANTTGRIPTLIIVTDFFGAVGNFTDRSQTFQYFENTTQVFGKHTLYFGFNVEHLTDTGNSGTNNSGQFTFVGSAHKVTSGTNTLTVDQFDQSFAEFLSGTANSFTQASVDPTSNLQENLYEAYLQDNWRATSTLTLNMGLRYSIFKAPADSSAGTSTSPNGTLGSFQPEAYQASAAPTVGLDGNICTASTAVTCVGVPFNSMANSLNGIVGGGGSTSPYGRSVSRTPLLDFAPRVGFAWNVYGDGKTSLRGGFGIFYEEQPLTTFQNLVGGNPAYVQNPVYTNPASFSSPSQIAAGTAPVQVISGVARNWVQPYVEAWNLDFQQQLSKNDLLDIGYVGNNTVHLQGEEDVNQIPADLYLSTNVTAGLYPNPNTTFACAPTSPKTKCTTETALDRIRPYLGWGPINYSSTRYFADYSGLQTSLVHRAGRATTIALSYTFSKSLANSGGPPNGLSGAKQFDPQNRFDLKPEWGPSLLDRRNLFVANVVYLFPRTHHHGFIGGVENGWEISGIVQLVSGLWWTAYQANNDPGGQGGAFAGSDAQLRPDILGNPNHYLKTQAAFFNPTVFNAIPTQGEAGGSEHVGVIEGPGYESYNVDLFKNFDLPRETSFQIRVEAFNVPNHVNFKNIQTQTSNAAFGGVTTAYDNRQMQIGAKLIF